MKRTLSGILLALASATTTAHSFPAKPVRFMVGYAPGGGADVLTRMVARKLSDAWGQPVVVENRSGAGGTIAATMVANAQIDGYTILMITSNHAVPSKEYATSYDPVRHFAPIIELAYIPSALLAGPALRVSSVKEGIDLARVRPKSFNFGSTGSGTAQYLDMQRLMRATAIDLVNVTYKGASPILVALLSNEVQTTLQPITAFIDAVRTGKLKALVITGRQRSPLLPDVPICSEVTALNGFEGSANWYGIVAPSGTPKPLIARLHDDIDRAIRAPDVQRILPQQGYVTVGGTPDQFAQRIVDDVRKWAELSRTLGL
jgi:tripartite-type tricarboxylate transporter receptor subunit TctC